MGANLPIDEHAARANSEASHKAGFREVAAVALVWIPFLVVSVSYLLWRTRLPDILPRQWDAEGVSSTMPLWIFLAVVVVLTLASAIGATLTLPADVAPNRRTILGVSGCVAAIAAGFWIAEAAVVVATVDGAEPDIGGWPLLALLAGVYGFIPRQLARPADTDDAEY